MGGDGSLGAKGNRFEEEMMICGCEE